MSDLPITGRCFCGAVRYRVMVKPKFVGICYCQDCTRAVGSVVTMWADFPAEKFEFTGNEPVRFESSPGIIRTFCGQCGTSLTYHDKDGSKGYLATATLDDPNALPPTCEGPGEASLRPSWMGPLKFNKPDK